MLWTGPWRDVGAERFHFGAMKPGSWMECRVLDALPSVLAVVRVEVEA